MRPPGGGRLLLAGSLLGAGLVGAALAQGPVETPAPATPPSPVSREEDNARWISLLAAVNKLSPEQQSQVEAIVTDSHWMGTGNPAVTVHPLSPEQCRANLAQAGQTWQKAEDFEVCGSPFMAPLYDPATQSAKDATTCIDRLEFPGIPCEYPVVWVRAKEAEELCRAIGKRLCDAHEWEGGCQGELGPADYRFDLARGVGASTAVNRMRDAHNRAYRATARWSYGPEFRTGVCAQSSSKTSGCTGGSWTGCGSNTYPAGSFPDCQSPLGVGDINGNAAEHMNLPLAPDQMASAGTRLGVTEMKGSWFIWDKYRAHEDWCRWRAPYWHGGPVMAADSHHNYHLGFRCCKDVGAPAAATPALLENP